MAEWKAKRFWKQARVNAHGDGFSVALDDRPIRTPSKAALVLPTRRMAEAVAAEWDAQTELIDPLSMPFTRSANTAIDKLRPQRREVVEMLAAYGDADLLCYRAPEPAELIARQSRLWDPALDWAESEFGVRLEVRSGVIHQPQDGAGLSRLRQFVNEFDVFRLTGFHDLVSLSGSLILGLAAARNWRDPDDLWTLSRLDELWQEEKWGPDEEARAAAEIKRQAFLHAKRFFDVA